MNITRKRVSSDEGLGNEKLLLNHPKMPGFLASGGEEFNLGPEMSLDRSELLCIKFYLSIKEIRKASDIDIRRGRKSTCFLVLSMEL